jgi:hypothetical protein
MGLTAITGVFSRYFVVGFFLPAYVALVSLWLCASAEFVPNDVDKYSVPAQLLFLGGVALVAGLALSGLSYYITRVFEGYPLERTANWPVVGLIYQGAIGVQRWRFGRLVAIRDDEKSSAREVQRAAWHLDRFYPEKAELLLPTRVGNAIRAFERHSNIRWGLDGVAIWPRIELLLSSDERELLVDAKINFYVFINAALGAALVGVSLIVDEAVYAPQPSSYWALYAIPFVVAYLLYRAAIGPASDWGDCVRSSYDLHRLEIYEKLGVRAPKSFSDERKLATKVNMVLLYGHPLLANKLWRPPSGSERADASG